MTRERKPTAAPILAVLAIVLLPRGLVYVGGYYWLAEDSHQSNFMHGLEVYPCMCACIEVLGSARRSRRWHGSKAKRPAAT